MNRLRLLVFMGVLLAIAVIAPSTALAKRGGTDRPVKGEGSGATTANLATGAATSQGTLHLSHTGKTTATLNTTLTPTGPNTVALTGTSTHVAANGDTIFATLTGTITGIGVGESADFTVVFTITGGTGRFADASGTLTGRGSQLIVSQVGATLTLSDTFTLSGTISY